MIQVTEIKKHYRLGGDIVKALDGVTFMSEIGDFFSIVGPSGSGKSTLMHIIGGLDKPDYGTVEINGESISKLKDRVLAKYRNKQVGFVFQTFNLQPRLTAVENVELPLIFAGIKPQKRKKMAKEALKKVGLENRLYHKPTELSGGQRQRVSIARAIVNSPSIILADEPTGNLDSVTGQKVIDLLKELNKNEKVTVIIVTHDLDLANQTERIIRLKDGKIIEDKKI